MGKFYCETQLSERISKTPEGFLVCHDVPITVAGDMYYSPESFDSDIKAKNGHVRVAKKIEDIHSDETIRSFEGKPITLGHPKSEDGLGLFVTPENARELTRGVIQNVRPGSGKMFDKLLADFVITDKEAIDLVESGSVREVSCGYNYEAANVHDGFFEQTNIRGNHVALVPRGRAGPQCAIFDSKDEDKSMSLKDKLKDALSVFSKAIDAVPDEEQDDEMDDEEESDVSKKAKGKKKPMAEKVAKKVAKSADESPMEQAMENMAFMNLDARISTIEQMLSDLTQKFTAAVLGKAADLLNASEEADEGEATDAAEPEVTYDAIVISNAEILAPGISKKEANLQRRALDEFYKTESGKKIITPLLHGKSFDEIDTHMLFTASATLVSAQRSSQFKQTSAYDAANKQPDLTNIATLNKANADFWSNNKIGVIH
ncbi:MAG: DUF2213 domain-containing protein [Alphaproteobacteria bacterium]|nr:DUF2213 domain-containing protein [Alphaproteobacteria bacterium]